MLRRIVRRLKRTLSNNPESPSISYYDLGLAHKLDWRFAPEPINNGAEINPLGEYFDSHLDGRGIWKWRHYFDIYHRHLAHFREREVHVLEIGVYSGGSLEMWKSYFGTRASIYGVDLEAACQVYNDSRTRIFVGNQADRGFWARFKSEVPALDIVIDDGGHEAEQQRVTFEELMPHLRGGGVYLCEDLGGGNNRFASYIHGFSSHLNATYGFTENLDDPERRVVVKPTDLQAAVGSVHLYPFVAVVERTSRPPEDFRAPKHGTSWQPFLS
ncbi:MAG TPA: class I SAM-dependent methyltransferase [Planctomycetaceae bacterium]|jgi:hypothetical protein